MTLKNFLLRLGLNIVQDIPEDETIQIELPDETYRTVKEIYYLSNPNRTIIRLENE